MMITKMVVMTFMMKMMVAVVVVIMMIMMMMTFITDNSNFLTKSHFLRLLEDPYILYTLVNLP